VSVASLRLSVVFAELAGTGVDSACGQDRHALAAGGEKVGFDVSDLMEEFRRQLIGTGDGPQVRLGQTVPSSSSTFTSRRQGNGFSGVGKYSWQGVSHQQSGVVLPTSSTKRFATPALQSPAADRGPVRAPAVRNRLQGI